jgi:hypothetical protein
LCGQSDGGQTFKALIWARGKEVHRHRGVAALVADMRTAPTMSAGMNALISGAVMRWHWAETAEVIDKSRSGDDGETEYETHVSRRPLMEPLRVAQVFVRTVHDLTDAQATP